MVRDRRPNEGDPEAISIVGAGMKFVGDCETDGSLRIEGTFEGSVRAGGEVVVGPSGVITGDLRARDAIVAGRVEGTVIAESRLELRESSHVDGEVYAGRIRVGDGAVVNAQLRMGEQAVAEVLRARPSNPVLRLEHAAEARPDMAEIAESPEPEAKRRTV